MKKLLVFATTFLVLLTSQNAVSEKSQPKLFYDLRSPIEQSLLVVRLNDSKVLFQLNPDKALIPASVTKIITAAAVLHTFGPAFKFKTRIAHSGTRAGAKIQGDLIVVGDGDPFLVNEKLWQLAADLRHLGLREISGNLVIDNSLFDQDFRDRSRAGSAKRSSHAYDAPVSALGVNFNTVAVAMAPAENQATPPLVGLDPYPIPGLEIENHLTSVNSGKSWYKVARISESPGNPKIVVRGQLKPGDKLVKLYRSVYDPVWASGELLKVFLAKEGIEVKGNVTEGKLPAQSQALLEVESYDLGFIVKGLNQYSNNFIADVLVKRLGAAAPPSGPSLAAGSGSLANGVHVLSEFLKKDAGIKTPFAIYNGSGLDHHNRLSAAQIATVLSYMNERFDIFPEFLQSLPASGINGTLSDRFSDNSTKHLTGQIRAKTGTLTEPVSVSSLAGYLRHPRHGLLAFVFIENGIAGKPQPSIMDLRHRQDRAINNILEQL